MVTIGSITELLIATVLVMVLVQLLAREARVRAVQTAFRQRVWSQCDGNEKKKHKSSAQTPGAKG